MRVYAYMNVYLFQMWAEVIQPSGLEIEWVVSFNSYLC